MDNWATGQERELTAKLYAAIRHILFNLGQKDLANDVTLNSHTVSIPFVFSVTVRYSEQIEKIQYEFNNCDVVYLPEYAIKYAVERCLNILRQCEVAKDLFDM